jgi:hypothetical protein
MAGIAASSDGEASPAASTSVILSRLRLAARSNIAVWTGRNGHTREAERLFRRDGDKTCTDPEIHAGAPHAPSMSTTHARMQQRCDPPTSHYANARATPIARWPG